MREMLGNPLNGENSLARVDIIVSKIVIVRM